MLTLLSTAGANNTNTRRTTIVCEKSLFLETYACILFKIKEQQLIDRIPRSKKQIDDI